jgi:CubicO group peptidase (beta-lactamase class C family)
MSNLFTTLTEFARQEHEKSGVPGFSLAVLHEGAVSSAGFGVTNRDHPLPVTPDTLFQVGSITKTLTATLIMRLVEQGKLGLDDPVRRRLPEFRVRDAQVSAQATIRHLLTHTGGWLGDVFQDTGSGADALSRYVALMSDQEQAHPLGGPLSYNNAGFAVAGAIIEAVTGKAYEQALREMLLAPLGMQACYFTAAEAITYRFAVGHNREGQVARPWQLGRAIAPMGGLIVSASDLLRYAAFHLGDGTAPGGERLLQPESLAAMRQPQITFWEKRHVGLSWFLSDLYGPRTQDHGGGVVGQETLLTLLPEKGFAIAAFSNRVGGGKLNRRVTAESLKLYFGLESSDQPKPQGASVEALAPYAGRYETAAASVEAGLLGGRLIAQFRSKIGFPSQHEPPPPPPPPMALDLCAPDRLIALPGYGEGDTIEVIRRADGQIGWVRSGMRLYPKTD